MTTKGCVDTPPPTPPVLVLSECDYEICLDRENAGKLARWTAQVRRWADETWVKCRGDE